ncbi:hypothetical protein, partial [Salmonella enterica]|uniref:hypothetical protein n=1 Tax=Salmonella enterica TaxID=28901 RepID=UPI0020C43C98
SLAVVQGTQISSLVADEQYYVGKLNYFKFMQWQLSQNLGWMLLITFRTALGGFHRRVQHATVILHEAFGVVLPQRPVAG